MTICGHSIPVQCTCYKRTRIIGPNGGIGSNSQVAAHVVNGSKFVHYAICGVADKARGVWDFHKSLPRPRGMYVLFLREERSLPP
jgi:hypothetical protein